MQSYNSQNDKFLQKLSIELHNYLRSSPGQQSCFVTHESIADNLDGSHAVFGMCLGANLQAVRLHVQKIVNPLNLCIQILLSMPDEKKQKMLPTLVNIISLAHEVANKNKSRDNQNLIQVLLKAKTELIKNIPKDSFREKSRFIPKDSLNQLNLSTTEFIDNYSPTIESVVHISELRCNLT